MVRFESASWTVTLCNLFVVPLQIFLFSVIIFLFSLLRPCEIFPLRQDKLIILHESFFSSLVVTSNSNFIRESLFIISHPIACGMCICLSDSQPQE